LFKRVPVTFLLQWRRRRRRRRRKALKKILKKRGENRKLATRFPVES
jgi:hypothetical protein